MNGMQQHIIRRNTLKVNATTSDGLDLQRKFSDLLNGEISTRMSDLFDMLVNENEWLIIERLDIQLDNIREDELDTNFANLLLNKLKVQLEQKRDQIITGAIIDTNAAVTISAREKALEAFLFFLEKGILPWWFEVTAHFDFERELVSALKQIYTLPGRSIEYYSQQFKKILTSETAAVRLAEQFSEEVFETVINYILPRANIPADTVSLQTILKELSFLISSKIDTKNASGFLSGAKSLLIRKIGGASQSPETLLGDWLSEVISQLTSENFMLVTNAMLSNKILNKYIPQEIKQRYKDLGIDKKSLPGKTDEIVKVPEYRYDIKREIESLEGVMVKNAGLVIVTPFLPQLFAECGIMNDNAITDIDKAIALLHFIVWGNLEYREYDTVLNKVICNVDSSSHIKLIDGILTEDKDKINELLDSIIMHWAVLKNTSPDGLRESFLQRKGKLSYKYDNWFLQVEQNTIDILLQSLPWTIGFIKLPWMNTMLKTEWN